MRKKYRKYIFAIVFIRKKEPKILILHRIKNWRGWELVKGGLKGNENELNCLKREIREETGVKKYKILAKTHYFIKYKFPKGFVKDHHIFHGAKGYMFLVELFSKKVKVDRSEHDGFKWVNEKEALKLLTHRNHKNALKYVLKNYRSKLGSKLA